MFFLILANKTLHEGWFPGNFLKEHLWTAASEIVWESYRNGFLPKKKSLGSAG